MKLLLVNDSGEQLACLQNVEEYSVKDSSRVFAMLDVLESMIVVAKKNRPADSGGRHIR